MKRQLTLKLIESNESPKIGDIVRWFESKYDKYLYAIWEQADEDATNHKGKAPYFGFTVIKPIAISDEEIKVGDTVLINCSEGEIYNQIDTVEQYLMNDILMFSDETSIGVEYCKKIELLPNHFSPTIKQFIVDGLLKDGDAIEVEYEQYNYLHQPSNFVDHEELVLDTEGYAHISISSKESIHNSADYAFLINHIVYTKELGNAVSLGIALEACSDIRKESKVMYSEDEVFTLLDRYRLFGPNSLSKFKEWFEQNKKK